MVWLLYDHPLEMVDFPLIFYYHSGSLTDIVEDDNIRHLPFDLQDRDHITSIEIHSTETSDVKHVRTYCRLNPKHIRTAGSQTSQPTPNSR